MAVFELATRPFAPARRARRALMASDRERGEFPLRRARESTGPENSRNFRPWRLCCPEGSPTASGDPEKAAKLQRPEESPYYHW
jgi:hypothetical protein